VANFYVGLSGYSYKPWQGEGRFYPVGLKQKDFLAHYSTRYPAVEMDGSWYKTPTEEAVAGYVSGGAPEFQYSFKVHRRITHLGRLKEETWEMLPFLLKRLAPLATAGKLGPFQIQLPPNFKRDDERLRAFFEHLPQRFEGGEPARWSMEFRHESWACTEVENLLRQFNVAWIASDRDDARADRRDTADTFAYVRLRRMDTDEKALDGWMDYFKALMENGKDVYVYCKHEDDGSPWIWADYLLSKL
jgi:uncharacterized protein YecE (DUF72 family)